MKVAGLAETVTVEHSRWPSSSTPARKDLTLDQKAVQSLPEHQPQSDPARVSQPRRAQRGQQERDLALPPLGRQRHGHRRRHAPAQRRPARRHPARGRARRWRTRRRWMRSPNSTSRPTPSMPSSATAPAASSACRSSRARTRTTAPGTSSDAIPTGTR